MLGWVGIMGGFRDLTEVEHCFDFKGSYTKRFCTQSDG